MQVNGVFHSVEKSRVIIEIDWRESKRDVDVDMEREGIEEGDGERERKRKRR